VNERPNCLRLSPSPQVYATACRMSGSGLSATPITS
jgi:hypothetical protein